MSISMREIESRATPSPVELRSAESRRVGGLGAVFGKPSQNLGGFIEVVEPRAFSKAEGDGFSGVVARYEHKDLLGTVAAQTLRLSVDSRGLDYEVDLPDTTAGNDVLALTRRGDLRNSSFSFQVYDQDFTHENGTTVRHLTSVRLIDVAPVTIPAYPDATLALRSLAVQFDADPDDVARMARENTLSKLFVRTDNRGRPATTLTGRQALIRILGMKYPEQQSRSMTGKQAVLETLRLRWPQPPPMTGRQAVVATLGMRHPDYETAADIGLDENY
jgi:uncharacterized protein